MQAPRFIKLRSGHKILIGLLLPLVLALISIFPLTQKVFEGLENRTQDYIYLYRGSQPAGNVPVVMVFIDEKSLDRPKYNFRAPTPRLLLADVVQNLNTLGARCIGLDFLILRKHFPKHDQALEAALKASKAPVVTVRALPKDLSDFNVYKDAMQYGIMKNLQPYTKLGFSEVITDGRGIAREMMLKDKDGKNAFAMELFETCQGKPVALPDYVNPGAMTLHYYGTPSRLTDDFPVFTTVSAFELEQLAVQARRDPSMISPFKGKIVLIGSGAESLADKFPSPFSVVTSLNPELCITENHPACKTQYLQTFGVELHAMALAMFLGDHYIGKLQSVPLIILLFIFFAAISYSALFLRTLYAVLLYPLFAATWITLSGYMFISENTIMAMALPLIMGVVAFLLCQVLLYATETRYSKFLKTTFSRYISPEVVTGMVDKGWAMNLGGELREMSILFSDLANFTTLSESLSPPDLVKKLNIYFTDVTEKIFQESGTVGDFIGDAVMAYWGAPSPQPDHPSRVCRAALGMHVALEALNEQWTREKLPLLGQRIGINTGEVILGNVGSEYRQDFTIIGDAVNLSARLEGVNKIFGTKTIVSQSTLDGTAGEFRTRQLGRIVVKGKTKPIQIYELVGLKSDPATGEGAILTPRQNEQHHRYEEALQLYYVGNFQEALRLFEQNIGADGDKASQFMVEQCRHLIESPPIEDWVGAVILTSK